MLEAAVIELADRARAQQRRHLRERHLSLAERERIAYIEGRTGEAALLALADESEQELSAQARLREEALEKAEDEKGRLESELDDAKAEIEQLKDEARQDQAAYTTLQRECEGLHRKIHEAGVDLV